jgi:uncharacterized membrane protein YhaH (DUF805 family)
VDVAARTNGHSQSPTILVATEAVMATLYRLYQLLFSFQGRINRAKFWLGAAVYCSLYYVLLGPLPSVATRLFRLPDQLSIWDSWRIIGLVGMLVATLVAAFWSALAIGAKRLHDRGKPGEWMLVFLLPWWIYDAVASGDIDHRTTEWPAWVATGLLVAAIVVLLWAVVELGLLPGTSGTNRYGEDPLGPAQG